VNKEIKMNKIAKIVFRITIIVATVFILSGADCHKSKPPVVGPMYGVFIDLFNHAPEATIGENVYIRGDVRDGLGNPQAGIWVYFTVTPDSVGQITPWSKTDPNSETGFEARVTFQGRKGGFAVIKGAVRDAQDRDTSADTINIWVRDPING